MALRHNKILRAKLGRQALRVRKGFRALLRLLVGLEERGAREAQAEREAREALALREAQAEREAQAAREELAELVRRATQAQLE